ncbi:MAG: hypothetical protein IPP31_10480 [Chitinophagaceae bacterium]|nr:hypothetical protein [Chitinophagaceae bacterium]
MCSGKEFPVTGLPANLKGGNLTWSPAGDKAAFTHTTDNTVDAYVIDIKTRKAVKINKTPLNQVLNAAFDWIDNKSILYSAISKPVSMAPKAAGPQGPVIQRTWAKWLPV